MFDIKKLYSYKENNRIEAKSAKNGLPRSIWETYSSFANTLGGVILLGVDEINKSLKPGKLSNPDKLIKEIWDNLNNPQKVSVNILMDKDITVERIDGKDIIVINVPRAQRSDRPVYIGENPLSGTYRRNGEGDYKCKKEEVQAMLRDASYKSQDMLVLNEMDMTIFDYESIRSYRMRMKLSRPGHVWETLEDDDFLQKIGAVGRGEDHKIHPTAAGLLMFGHEYDIVREFPNYFLDYQEQDDVDTRWSDRIVSSSGDWSGNIYDYYFRIYNKIALDIKKPFKIENGARVEDTPVHKAIREAIANCLIHADYYGRQGIVIKKQLHTITLSNPGNFRIDIATARSGGVSDPRNATLIKMFNLIDIGERSGSGIPNIFKVWSDNGSEPVIKENFDPDRVTLLLDLSAVNSDNNEGIGGKSAVNSSKKDKIGGKSAVNSSKKDKIGGKSAVNSSIKDKIGGKDEKMNLIINFISSKNSATTAEIANYVGLGVSRVRDYLRELKENGTIVAEGSFKDRRYKIIESNKENKK